MEQNRFARGARVGLPLALALATSDTPTVSAHEDGPNACSNRTLRGAYGTAIDGTLLPPSPAPSLLVRGVARQHFDGHGNMSQVDYVTLNGAPPSSDWRQSSGTYEVNADCTGTMETNFDDGRTLRQRLIVVDNGRQFLTVAEGGASGSTGTKVR